VRRARVVVASSVLPTCACAGTVTRLTKPCSLLPLLLSPTYIVLTLASPKCLPTDGIAHHPHFILDLTLHATDRSFWRCRRCSCWRTSCTAPSSPRSRRPSSDGRRGSSSRGTESEGGSNQSGPVRMRTPDTFHPTRTVNRPTASAWPLIGSHPTNGVREPSRNCVLAKDDAAYSVPITRRALKPVGRICHTRLAPIVPVSPLHRLVPRYEDHDSRSMLPR
jgi:hypothetical protein